jgi:hypothetical protein
MHIKGKNNLFQSSSVIIFSLKNKHLKLPFLNNFYLTKWSIINVIIFIIMIFVEFRRLIGELVYNGRVRLINLNWIVIVGIFLY